MTIKNCCIATNDFKQCLLCSKCNIIICSECYKKCYNTNCNKMVCINCDFCCNNCEKGINTIEKSFTKITHNKRINFDKILVNDFSLYNDSFIKKSGKLPENFYLYIKEFGDYGWFIMSYDKNTNFIKLQKNGNYPGSLKNQYSINCLTFQFYTEIGIFNNPIKNISGNLNMRFEVINK